MFNKAREFGKLEVSTELSYTIQENMTPWDIAKINLETSGFEANDTTVIEELYRLIEINGCTKISDLLDKFKVGNKIKLTADGVKNHPNTSVIKVDYISKTN